MIDKKKAFADVRSYSNWLSKLKVTGSEVVQAELYFIISTAEAVRVLVQA